MTNGSNSWGVSFSHISWLERLLSTHGNVAEVSRRNDIVFDIVRKTYKDHLVVLCCNEYVMGLTQVHRALAEFGKLNIVYIGGGWCGYTRQAKEFTLDQQIGLFVTDELSGALWKREYWNHHKRDQKGDPEYFYKST